MDTVGSFRQNGSPVDFDKTDRIDRCFATERQFGLFLTNYFKRDLECQLFWWNMKKIYSLLRYYRMMLVRSTFNRKIF